MANALKLLFLHLTLYAALPTALESPKLRADWRHTLSLNKAYSAEITDANEKLSVYKREESGPVLLWSRFLKRGGENRWPREKEMPFELVVANDGAAVALHVEQPFDESPALRLITRAGGDASFGEEEIKDPKTELTLLPSFHIFVGAPANVYAIWQEYSAKWLVVDLEQVSLIRPSQEAQRLIDREALEHARAIARLAVPGPLHRMARSIRATAADYVPSVAPSVDSADLSWTTKASLRYLAHRKQSLDRLVIERLLDCPLTISTPIYTRYRPTGEKLVALDSDKRALGDELLSVWDGKKSNGWRGPGLRELNFLGGIGGTVRLPFSVPPGACDMWVYLIPNKLSKDKWASDPEVLKIPCRLFDEFGDDKELPLDRFRFAFDTIPAGEYRLKAIWDRSAPFAKDGPAEMAVAQPGDYESVESPPIELRPGTTVSNLLIQCTNSVGKGANYSADEKMSKITSQTPA